MFFFFFKEPSISVHFIGWYLDGSFVQHFFHLSIYFLFMFLGNTDRYSLRYVYLFHVILMTRRLIHHFLSRMYRRILRRSVLKLFSIRRLNVPCIAIFLNSLYVLVGILSFTLHQMHMLFRHVWSDVFFYLYYQLVSQLVFS